MDLIQEIYDGIDDYVDHRTGTGKNSPLDDILREKVLQITDTYENTRSGEDDHAFAVFLQKKMREMDPDHDSNVWWFIHGLISDWRNNSIHDYYKDVDSKRLKNELDFRKYLDPLSEFDSKITLEEIKEDIMESDNPDLAKNSSVTQLWNDGEITSQKAGGLLWQRTLHNIHPGIDGINIDMPHKHDNYSYIFCTGEDAKRIREKMLEYKMNNFNRLENDSSVEIFLTGLEKKKRR